MNLRFANCRLLASDMTVLDKAELITSGDKIVFSGKAEDAAAAAGNISFDRVIDCRNDLLMPGFKNAHTHTAMTFARSLADDLTLNDWLHKAIFPREAKLTAEHIYWFLKLGFAEYIANGITSCFDMYFQPDATAKAAVDTGFRFVFCGSVNDFGGIDRLEDEYNRFNSYDDLVSYRLGFHAEYTTSENIMKTISDIAHKYEAPVFAHISETEAEVAGCIERYGKSPVKVFDELGLYDFGGGGFHCVWFDDEDMKIYKDKGLYAVFNACSNLKLASGIAPVAKFREYGINTAIGTDGAGSNNALDMFREMYLDNVLSNIGAGQAAVIPPAYTLEAAVSVGSRCMGLSDCVSLDAGMKADFIRIDMKAPVSLPENNIVANLVYSGNPSLVKMTVIGGKILYENGEFTTIDMEEVRNRTKSLMADLA